MSVPRSRARRGEGDRLRGEILNAAEDLLTETADSSAVSIRAIADRVGVTAPSIYRHFSDKEDLLEAVCELVFTRLDTALERAAADATDPFDELDRKGRAYVEFGLEFPEHYRLVFMRPEPSVPDRAVLTGPALTGSNAFTHLVASADRVSALLPADRRPDGFTLACSMWTAVHGIVSLRIAKCEFPWPALEDQLALISAPWRIATERAPTRRRSRPRSSTGTSTG